MLTSDLALSYRRGEMIRPRLIDADDPRHLQTAEELIRAVEAHLERRRAELDAALDEYIGVGTDYKVLRGLIKLLLDRCEFATVSPRPPAALRQLLFTRAAAQHPVIAEEERARLIDEIAAELECAPKELLEGLYADLSDNQRLARFEALSAPELLDLYNLAQAQALLYRCSEMRLWIDPQAPAQNSDGVRRLFAEIKRFRLIHAIEGDPATGYEVRLGGPVSIFHRSQKYGIQMAVFLPALLNYSGWRMRAEIGSPTGPAFFELNARQTQLRSHYIADDHAPQAELLAKVLTDFQKLGGAWSVAANREVISFGRSAFIPDLTFIHESGRSLYFEMLGYWTPRHLTDRVAEFQRAGFTNYLLAASEELRCSRDAPTGLPSNVFLFKKSLNARELQMRLSRLIDSEEI